MNLIQLPCWLSKEPSFASRAVHPCHWIKYPSFRLLKVNLNKKHGVESLENKGRSCEKNPLETEVGTCYFHLEYKLHEFSLISMVFGQREGEHGKLYERYRPMLWLCAYSVFLSLQLFWLALTTKLRGPGYENVKLVKLKAVLWFSFQRNW